VTRTKSELSFPSWRKASRSMAGNGDCVEAAAHAAGDVIIRDSKDPYGPILQYSTNSWYIFVRNAKQGRYDVDSI
jgi:hypothetical protein